MHVQQMTKYIIRYAHVLLRFFLWLYESDDSCINIIHGCTLTRQQTNVCQCASEVTLNVMGGINICQTITKHNKAWTECTFPDMYNKWVNMHYINKISIKAWAKYGPLFTHKVSKPRDWMFYLSYYSKIWQASRQHCCRGAGQISERLARAKHE